ncbi:MAG: hypothetical protein E6Q97_09490 [Desulfurellales bacterium]|nr:MAG: hypothetical protein E6Q97_09490 [Desulfurellales bacterium]
MANDPGFITTGQLAVELQEPLWRVQHWLATKRLPEPRHRLAGKRAWSVEEVAEVKRLLSLPVEVAPELAPSDAMRPSYPLPPGGPVC